MTRRILLSWTIIDPAKWQQVAATDRYDHAESQRRKGFGLFQYETEIEVTAEGEFSRVVNRQTIYMPPMGEKE